MPKVARTQSSNSPPSDSPPRENAAQLHAHARNIGLTHQLQRGRRQEHVAHAEIGHQLHRRLRLELAGAMSQRSARRDTTPETAHRTARRSRPSPPASRTRRSGLGKKSCTISHAGQMAEQHAMAVQRALWISGGAGGVDDDGGIVGRCVDGREILGGSSRPAPPRTIPRRRATRPVTIDMLQLRQPARGCARASPSPPASVTMALAPESRRRNSSASSPNSVNSGTETKPGAKRRQMRDRQFPATAPRNTATRSPRTRPDPPSAHWRSGWIARAARSKEKRRTSPLSST